MGRIKWLSHTSECCTRNESEGRLWRGLLGRGLLLEGGKSKRKSRYGKREGRNGTQVYEKVREKADMEEKG